MKGGVRLELWRPLLRRDFQSLHRPLEVLHAPSGKIPAVPQEERESVGEESRGSVTSSPPSASAHISSDEPAHAGVGVTSGLQYDSVTMATHLAAEEKRSSTGGCREEAQNKHLPCDVMAVASWIASGLTRSWQRPIIPPGLRVVRCQGPNTLSRQDEPRGRR